MVIEPPGRHQPQRVAVRRRQVRGRHGHRPTQGPRLGRRRAVARRATVGPRAPFDPDRLVAAGRLGQAGTRRRALGFHGVDSRSRHGVESGEGPARRDAHRRRRQRGDDAVARRGVVEHGARHPGVRRGQALDLVPHLVDARHVQTAGEPIGQLSGHHPVGPALPGRHQLLGESGDPAFDVRRGPGALVRDRHGQHHVGQRGRGREEAVDRHHEAGATERLLGQHPVREVAHGVGAHQHHRRHRPVGQRFEHARGVAAATGGHRSPRLLVPPTTLVEAHPAREQTGGETHVQRAHDVAAPQRGQKTRLRPRLGHRRRRRRHERPVLGQRRAPDHDHDALAALTGVRQGVARRLPGVVVNRVGPLVARPRPAARARAVASPGR